MRKFDKTRYVVQLYVPRFKLPLIDFKRHFT